MTIANTPPGSISGVYNLNLDLNPSEGVNNEDPKLKPIEDAASRPLPLYVHERDGGEVVAHLGGLDFKGSRRDAELILTTTGMPLKVLEKLPEGASERSGEMVLTLVDGKWTGKLRLLDQTTVNVALEERGDLPSESFHDFANFSLLDVGSILCSGIQKIVNAILDALEIEIGDTIRPMSSCGPSKAGRGYYLFGQNAPGNNFPPVFLSTIYMPFDTVSCGKTSHDYSFSLSLGDFAFNPQSILNDLRSANKFLSAIGIHIDSFLDELQDFLNTINRGRFAVSFQVSAYTRSVGLYFNNAMGITTDDLENKPSFAWFRTLKSGINRLTNGALYVYAGETCTDTWSAYNGIIPFCNVPFFFVYLFGTANVHYD